LKQDYEIETTNVPQIQKHLKNYLNILYIKIIFNIREKHPTRSVEQIVRGKKHVNAKTRFSGLRVVVKTQNTLGFHSDDYRNRAGMRCAKH
jgi:hypothetical protein